jgi:ABC-type phosphate/phosphonate transport system substrate-binding protein
MRQNKNEITSGTAMNFIFIFYLVVSSLLLGTGSALANEIRIGVLNIRGTDEAIKSWQQVSEHLSMKIPEHHFVIVPLNYQALEQAVADKQLEFVVANPSQYVELSEKFGVSRIATQISHVGKMESPYIGSVIFTKANRTDISTLSDLRGKSLVSASKSAFASWLVTRDELKRHSISTNDLSSVRFIGSADKVVMAVKNGEADCGAVLTDILESMEKEGKIAITEFRILNQHHVEGYPFLLSSDLYPDFAFARLKHTDMLLANNVAAQLLLIPHDKTDSRYPNLIGWSVPDNYDSVSKLLQKWRLPPYEDFGKITLKEAFKQHWVTVSLALISFSSLLLIVSLNHNIKQRRRKYLLLKEAKQELEASTDLVLKQRDLLAHQKGELEAALSKVKQLEGIIPICSYCHKIRDDQNIWFHLEKYISDHSEALFSHGICPHCFEEQKKEIENMGTKTV